MRELLSEYGGTLSSIIGGAICIQYGIEFVKTIYGILEPVIENMM